MGILFSSSMLCRKCKEPLIFYSQTNKSNEINCYHRFKNNKCIDCNEDSNTELRCKTLLGAFFTL